MTGPSRSDLINYRLQQADESIQEAKTLAHAALWRGAINRSDYAMFYAALALTVLKQQPTSKHSGVIAFFDKEFVRTGILPKDLSRYLHFAFDRRQNSDYGEIYLATQAEAEQAIKEAEDFVNEVKVYLLSI